MLISYIKELPALKISKNKEIKCHISKNEKRPTSNLNETPFPPHVHKYVDVTYQLANTNTT